jgi:chemotaxis protein methyltransferase CheR
LLIWSAGCSTGEEPYTLAIVLSEYALTHPGFRFRILATDISNIVLEKAEMGVYSKDDGRPGTGALKRKYLMASRDPGSDQVRVVPELRRLIEFRRLNFMDADYGITEKADAIFCRNVIIYFDRETQERSCKSSPGNWCRADTCSLATPKHCTIWIFLCAGGSGSLQEGR